MLVKKDVIASIAKRTGIAQKDVELVLNTNAEIVVEGLRKGEEVAIVGLGKLATSNRSGRTARNPRTGAEVQVPPSIGVKFKPSTSVKTELN
jgi:DNA-binding protein HU-beta